MKQFAWTDFLVCPDDSFSLQPEDGGMTCPVCHRCYEVRDDIAVLLPDYSEDERLRYFDNYQRIAREDLVKPLEGRRDIRNEELLRFLGDTRGKRVLDIGSGDAAYLRDMNADFLVAMDIAMPYLQAIPPNLGIMRVCADAERLPIAAGFFDVIILSGVLEHVLSPENLVARLHQVCRPDTRIVVLVPWEEDLSPYKGMEWEFTHLRSFNSYSFSALWHQFRILRRRPIWPRLGDPLLFRIDERLPTFVFDFLRYRYFHRGLAKVEAARRDRWSQELPRREHRLLRFYRPTFYEVELRTLAGSWVPVWYERVAHFMGFWSRMVRPRR